MKNQKKSSQEINVANMKGIGSDSWHHIFLFLNANEIALLSIVCQGLNFETNKKSVWVDQSIFLLSKHKILSSDELKSLKTKLNKSTNIKNLFSNTILVLALMSEISKKQERIKNLEKSLDPVVVKDTIPPISLIALGCPINFIYVNTLLRQEAERIANVIETEREIKPNIFKKTSVKLLIYNIKKKIKNTDNQLAELQENSLFSLLK